MSKSYNNTIPIFDTQKSMRKTVMSIVTDSKGLEDVKNPDNCNVVALYKLFATPEQVKEMETRYRAGNYGYGHAKQALFELLWEYFEPMRKQREELAKNLDYVWKVLDEGGEKARCEAEKTMKKVRKAVGLR
jgi:tryptophanyl-tRNA synthetase